VGETNDPSSYRQAALERIGETAYLIRDELALNKSAEEVAIRAAELLGLASQDFFKAGEDFQKDEPQWAGKSYPDYGLAILQAHALPLVKIMAHVYGQSSGAKSEVRLMPQEADVAAEEQTFFQGRLTPPSTDYQGRGRNLDYAVSDYLRTKSADERVKLVDLGIGYPPFTTIQTAQKFQSRLDVLGVDLNLPDYVLMIPSIGGRQYLLFYEVDSDKLQTHRINYMVLQRETGSGTLRYNEVTNLAERQSVRVKAESLRRQIFAKVSLADFNRHVLLAREPQDTALADLRVYANQKGFSLPRGSLDFAPARLSAPEFKNLKFIKGGFDLAGIDPAGIIRVGNVFRYYSAKEVHAALRQFELKLVEGGVVIAARDDNNFILFQKTRGTLTPKQLSFSPESSRQVSFDAAQFPEFAVLFKDIRRAQLALEAGRGDQKYLSKIAKVLTQTGYAVTQDLELPYLHIDLQKLPPRTPLTLAKKARSEVRSAAVISNPVTMIYGEHRTAGDFEALRPYLEQAFAASAERKVVLLETGNVPLPLSETLKQALLQPDYLTNNALLQAAEHAVRLDNDRRQLWGRFQDQKPAQIKRYLEVLAEAFGRGRHQDFMRTYLKYLEEKLDQGQAITIVTEPIQPEAILHYQRWAVLHSQMLEALQYGEVQNYFSLAQKALLALASSYKTRDEELVHEQFPELAAKYPKASLISLRGLIHYSLNEKLSEISEALSSNASWISQNGFSGFERLMIAAMTGKQTAEEESRRQLLRSGVLELAVLVTPGTAFSVQGRNLIFNSFLEAISEDELIRFLSQPWMEAAPSSAERNVYRVSRLMEFLEKHLPVNDSSARERLHGILMPVLITWEILAAAKILDTDDVWSVSEKVNEAVTQVALKHKMSLSMTAAAADDQKIEITPGQNGMAVRLNPHNAGEWISAIYTLWPYSTSRSEVRSLSAEGKLFHHVEGDAGIPLAIRYLDLFFQLAEEKVAVENQTGDRDFGFDIPRKGSRVSYTPPGASQVLLMATDFRFPGGDQDHIVMESDYPIWFEFQKGTGVLEAVYIAADKDDHDYLKLEILRKKKNRSELESFNVLPLLGDFKMQGPLIVEALLKQIPAGTKNELVLRASVVESERIGFYKRSEVHLERSPNTLQDSTRRSRSEVRASVVSDKVKIALDAAASPSQRENALFALEKLHAEKKVLPEDRPEFWRALIYAASLPLDASGGWKLYRAASSIFRSRVSAETGNNMNLRESEFRQIAAHIDIHQKDEELSIVLDAPGENEESAAVRIGTEILRGHSPQEFAANLMGNSWIRKSGLRIKAKDEQSLAIVLEDRLAGWMGALQSAGLWHGSKILDEIVPYKNARLLNRVLAVGLALGIPRSEVRSKPIDPLERYETLTSFYAGQTVREGMNWDGTLFVPSPLGVLPLIFDEVERAFGKPLENKNYLALGAGLLHDSLYAASVRGMNVKAIERDSALSTQAQDILSKAQRQNLVTELQVRFFPGEDAFDQSWADVDVAYFFYTQSGKDRKAYRANFEKRLIEKLSEMNPGSVLAMLFTGSQLMAEQADYEGLDPYFRDQIEISPERTGLYLRLYKVPSRSEARFHKAQRELPTMSAASVLTGERWILATHATGHLVPLDVRKQYGEDVFRAAVQILLLKLEPAEVPAGPALDPELTEHIRVNMPEFYQMMRVKPLAEARRLLEDASRIAPRAIAAPEKLLPLLALLASRPDLEYTLILEGDQQTAESFREALKQTVQNSKLGFNPFDLPNFKVVSEADETAVRRLVSQSLSKTQGATAVVSTRDTILDPLNAIPNLALVLVKNPLRQRDASLLTAAFLDELVQSRLVRFDEDSLAQQVRSQSLLLEVQALQAFLSAA